MADEDIATAAGSNAGQLGGGTPNDVPVKPSVRSYSQEEFDTNSAKLRASVTAEVARKRDSEWLEKLGASSFDEVATKLKQVQEQQQKTEKTEAQVVAEKMQADYTRILAEKDRQLAEATTALQAEAQRASEEKRRAFLLQHVADTTDPALAMALFGVQYAAPREIRMVDGKPTVFEDGVALAHVEPADYVKSLLSKPEFAFLRKPTQVGTGTRTGNGSAPVKAPVALGRKATHQELLDAAVAAGLASVNGSNGSGR